jgi:hypothetical protein
MWFERYGAKEFPTRSLPKTAPSKLVVSSSMVLSLVCRVSVFREILGDSDLSILQISMNRAGNASIDA